MTDGVSRGSSHTSRKKNPALREIEVVTIARTRAKPRLNSVSVVNT